MAITTTRVDVTSKGWALVATAAGAGDEFSASTREPASYAINGSVPAKTIVGEPRKPGEPFAFKASASGDKLYVRANVDSYAVNLMSSPA